MGLRNLFCRKGIGAFNGKFVGSIANGLSRTICDNQLEALSIKPFDFFPRCVQMKRNNVLIAVLLIPTKQM